MPTDLIELVSAELIDQTQFVPHQRYCFRHPLVRKVAYESQLTATRAVAHTRLADAIEARDPDTVEENAALIAAASGGRRRRRSGHTAGTCAQRNWLRDRDLAAARASWERCSPDRRRPARRTSTDIGPKRLAPHTMLDDTAYFFGDEYDTDEASSGIPGTGNASPAIGCRWRSPPPGKSSRCSPRQVRIPDSAALAAELVEMVDRLDCDAATELELLRSVMMAQLCRR